jgi:phospholipid transport system transporter-binding protein
MSEPYSIRISDEDKSIKVSGTLTFETVKNVLNETDSAFSAISSLDIDLDEVTRSDSAGLALLVHWLREAKNNDKKIVLHNIPAQMLSIADASGLDKLLPVQ